MILIELTQIVSKSSKSYQKWWKIENECNNLSSFFLLSVLGVRPWFLVCLSKINFFIAKKDIFDRNFFFRWQFSHFEFLVSEFSMSFPCYFNNFRWNSENSLIKNPKCENFHRKKKFWSKILIFGYKEVYFAYACLKSWSNS